MLILTFVTSSSDFCWRKKQLLVLFRHFHLQTFETQKERTKRKNNVFFYLVKVAVTNLNKYKKKITIFFETEMHHNHFSKTLSCHTNLKAK
jgi:hypothetical protein